MAVIESLLAQVLGHSDCLWHLHTPERSERSELAGEVLMRLAKGSKVGRGSFQNARISGF